MRAAVLYYTVYTHTQRPSISKGFLIHQTPQYSSVAASWRTCNYDTCLLWWSSDTMTPLQCDPSSWRWAQRWRSSMYLAIKMHPLQKMATLPPHLLESIGGMDIFATGLQQVSAHWPVSCLPTRVNKVIHNNTGNPMDDNGYKTNPKNASIGFKPD